MNEGWLSTNNGEEQIRVLKSAPWYAEFRANNTSEPYLSPGTLMVLMLKANYSMFGIECDVSTLLHETSVLVKDNTYKVYTKCEFDEKDGWITSTDTYVLRRLRHRSFEFIVKFNNVKIVNANGDSDFFPDFFLRVMVNHSGKINIGGWRQEVSYQHIAARYLHSHISGHSYTNPMLFNEFCTGRDDTPINSYRTDLENYFYDNKWTAPLLKGEELPPESISKFERIDKALSLFVANFTKTIGYESLDGVPYMYICNNKYTYTESGMYPKMEPFEAFALIVAKNISNPAIKFRLNGTDVHVLDSDGLLLLAQEHGFYESCYAGYSTKEGDFTIPVSKTSTLNSEVIDLIHKKTIFYQSPFYWKGKRLPLKLVSTNTTVVHESEEKINTYGRTHFDATITNYFKKCYLRYTLDASDK